MTMIEERTTFKLKLTSEASVAHIREENFSAFVRTMSTVLEDIERRTTVTPPLPYRPEPVQLELPLVILERPQCIAALTFKRAA